MDGKKTRREGDNEEEAAVVSCFAPTKAKVRKLSK
jgi:hypothetical protein